MPFATKFPVAVIFPVTARVDESKVKFCSPNNAFAPVAVIILLFTPFVKVGFPDAVPVKAPTNVVAVAIPVTFNC